MADWMANWMAWKPVWMAWKPDWMAYPICLYHTNGDSEPSNLSSCIEPTPECGSAAHRVHQYAAGDQPGWTP